MVQQWPPAVGVPLQEDKMPALGSPSASRQDEKIALQKTYARHLLKYIKRDFPGGPVTKTPYSQRGAGGGAEFDPLLEN